MFCSTLICGYLRQRPLWAILDHTKPGLQNEPSARSAEWIPSISHITRSDDAVAIQTNLGDVAHTELGAPASIEMVLRPIDEATLSITLIARDKPANRMPEASFLTFAPQNVEAWRFRKLGLWQQADKIALRGGGQLQAVEAVKASVQGDPMFEIVPLDTPLVAPRTGRFMKFNPGLPDFSDGIRFNLHNNKWGTNFPMWWGGDLVARFLLTIQDTPD